MLQPTGGRGTFVTSHPGGTVNSGPDSTTGLHLAHGGSKKQTGAIQFNPLPHVTARSTYVPGPGNAMKPEQRLGTLTVAQSQNKYNGLSRNTNWGFRFMYNPSEVQLRTEIVTSVDPSQQSMYTVGKLIPGMQAVSISLLLNRIADVADSSANPLAHARGTLADLEYFYRVFNGDPLMDSELGIQTADFGYILGGVAVRLTLGNGFRMVGYLNAVDLSHKQFTEDMIPVLSELSFSLQRYSTITDPLSNPAGETTDSKSKKYTGSTGLVGSSQLQDGGYVGGL